MSALYGAHKNMRLSSFRRFSSILIPGCTLLTAGLLLLSTYTYAESAAATGRLEGRVTDPSGASVPDADITIRNQNTGVSSAARSNGEGEFTALYLDPGTYEVSIQKAGFGKLVLQDIIITLGTRAIIHTHLTLFKIDTTTTLSPAIPSIYTHSPP